MGGYSTIKSYRGRKTFGNREFLGKQSLMAQSVAGAGLPGESGKVPVFVFPTALNFYTDDQSSHKQVLTLYNPYDFALKFKVMCTSPRKYSVVDAEGTIKSRCCGDIVVRHRDVCMNNEGVRDKFRIHVFEHGQRQPVGRKDVPSVLLPRKTDAAQADDNFESLAAMSTSGVRDSPSALNTRTFTSGRAEGAGGPGWVVIAAAIVCIAALMLPSAGDVHATVPAYLHLSLNLKLVAAYVLGLVTMAIMRS